MSDDDRTEMLLKHEATFTTLANAIEHLADVVAGQDSKFDNTHKAHADKLDEIISSMVDTKLIMEKFTYLDRELKDSFKSRDDSIKRAHKRLDKLEEMHSGTGAGCPALAPVKNDTDLCTSIRNWIFKIVGTCILLAILGTIIIKA